MKRYVTVKNALIAVAACLLIYTLLGFYALPFAGKQLIQKSFESYPDCTANVGAIRFNPFTLEAGLDNFEIKETAGKPVFKLKQLHLDISAESILKLAPVISRLELDGPELFLVLKKNTGLNLHRIFTGGGQEKKNKEPAADTADKTDGPFRFCITNASIHNGRFHFTDQIKNKTQVMDGINLSLPILSSLENDLNDHTRPVLRFGLNGAPVDIKLVSLPFDQRLDTRIDLSAKGVDLGAFESYMGLPKGLAPASLGHLDLTVSGSYHMDTRAATASGGHILGLNLKAALSGVDIRMKGTRPLVSCPKFRLNASSKNILDRHITIETLELIGAKMDLERDEKGQLSLLGLFQDKQVAAASTEPDSKNSNDRNKGQKEKTQVPFHITMPEGGLKQCVIAFTDRSVNPVFTTTLSKLDVGLKKMSISPDTISGDWHAGFETESMEHLVTQGRFSTAPFLTLAGRLDLKEVMPEKYRPYYSPYGGKGLAIGKTGLGAGFSVSMENGTPAYAISDGSLSLKDIRVQDQADDKPVVDIRAIDCKGIVVDSGRHSIRVDTVLADTGGLDLVSNKTGKINLLKRIEQMVPPRQDVDNSQVAVQEKTNKDMPSSSPWIFSLGRFDLKNYNVAFLDQGPLEPVDIRVADIAVSAQQITSAMDSKGKIQAAMTLFDTGKININGDIKPSPFEAVLDLDLGKIPVAPFQPYLSHALNVILSQGHAGAKGRLTISTAENQSPQIQFKGQTSLNEFLCKTKFDNQDIFQCQSLYASGMDIGITPLKIGIEKIALTDFYKKIFISKSGELNLNRLVKLPAEQGKKSTESVSTESADQPVEQQMPEINIGAVTLQGGNIHFTDLHNTPEFTAKMTEIGGSVTKFSSLPGGKPATVVLKGTHSGQAPLDISGQIDPFKKQPFVDLSVSFKNIEMPEFNPYAKRYLGYGFEKGKLILDLKYEIQDNKLKSRNHIFFDQLTLGERVNSPDAVNLPIPLAISLLKNGNDEIKLDVPIFGDLNDPEFKYGSVVAKAITNLILGVVTAPFKFLGSIVGIGEGKDLGYAAFAPGSDVLDEENKGKIDSLTRILSEKGGLNLEIDGQYNPNTDSEGIRAQKYQALLESVYAREKGMASIPGDLTIDQLAPEAHQVLVATAYATAPFPKPMDESGNEKELTLDEKEKLLLTSIDVTQEELTALGRRRSNTIRDYMVGPGKIVPSRIFIKAPVPVKEEKTKQDKIKTLFVIK